MKFSKCLALMVAFAVGFGIFGTVDDGHAFIKSIAIASPDSGALRGIDSVFVVRVEVQDFAPEDSLTVYVFLATDNTTVIGDAGAITTELATGQTMVSTVQRANGLARTSGIKSDAGVSTTGPANFVMARQKRGRGAILTASGPLSEGDADSIVVVTRTDTTTVFNWHGKVSAAVGTLAGVKAGAFSITGSTNNNTGDTSGVKLSVETLRIDGDRPTNPEDFRDRANVIIPNNGTLVIDDDDAVGEVLVKSIPGGDRNVINIGDSLSIRSKLGTANLNGALGSDSLSVIANLFGKNFSLIKDRILKTGVSRSSDVVRFDLVLTEGLFGDLNIAPPTNSDTFAIYMVDAAGNLSGGFTGNAVGVTAATTLLFDTTKPVLDGTSTTVSDTLLPAVNDTISDGDFNQAGADGLLDDGQGNRPDDVIQWKLGEALASLRIIFDGKKDDKATIDTVTISNTTNRALDHASLQAGQQRFLDISDLVITGTTRNSNVGSEAAAGGDRSAITGESYNSSNAGGGGANNDSLATGLFTLKFLPTDLAGNAGAEVSRTNVYIDFDEPVLKDLFPTKAAFGDKTVARLDTLESSTSSVVFTLSEAADSARIQYVGIEGSGKDSTRSKTLSGDELSKLTEQIFPVSLIDSSKYILTIEARDLAGNWIKTSPDTFFFASGFSVPSIVSFSIAAGKSGLEAADHLLAGAENVLTITAKASGTERDAVTYGARAVLKITGGSGLTATGTGVTAHAQEGLWVLDAASWVIGQRKVTLKDTAAIDTLTVSVIDSVTTLADGTNPTGALDSSIVYDPEIFSLIEVTADATVNAGENFEVAVRLTDSFGNTRVLDDRFAEITANKLGVEHPGNAIALLKGVGSFWAKSNWVGDGLKFMLRDIVDTDQRAAGDNVYPGTASNAGKSFIFGNSNSISVVGVAPPVEMALDRPDTLISDDYMGASGDGDQGGFVMLTFTVSDDHETVTAYRIWREVQVKLGLNDAGRVVPLDVPEFDYIPWGKVDAVPGVGPLMEVVVATLDNDLTGWALSAERGRQTTAGKQAFASGEAVTSPYEVMAQTMIESKQVAIDGAGAPVLAILTPEALAFIDKGVAPRFKEVGGIEVSAKTFSATRVRAIDNIAPEAVPFLSVMDTPGDAGNSITVTWAKSESDQMMTYAVNGAVGASNAYSVAGVKGYNVYRAVNGGEALVVGKASPGETSFVDRTVFNGVRYTYEVKPYDTDNESASPFARTAMAIRNNAKDVDGLPILGLFGADNTVGFDDFFIFADNFGLQLGDAGFESAFDLHPNSRIDFNDFFVFADNFGKAAKVAGKVVPNLVAGLNGDARIDLAAGAELPRVGEDMVIDVTLADFAEIKGYGFTVNYDGTALEFVKATTENNRLGEGDLAQLQVLVQTDGEVALGAFGETLSEGDVELSLIFRSKVEIEQSLIEVRAGELRDGNYALNQIASLGVVSVETRPEAFALLNNYPNPFNPETTIKYHLPEAAQVKLEIYNMVGQVVRTLVQTHQNAGRYVVQWDAANDNGQSLASGIYLYRIQAGDFHEVKKMLLLK